MKSTISPLALLLALAAPGALAAEDIYRSTMPDGRIIYGESPFPGAKSVRKVTPPPISTGTIVTTPAETGRAQGMQEPRGGVAVIPSPERQPGATVGPGGFQSPGGLPSRAY